jgi:hypothetical protein
MLTTDSRVQMHLCTDDAHCDTRNKQITDFLLVRVLVPWVLLYPWESGLKRGPGTKLHVVTHNCQVSDPPYMLLHCYI